jgi:hypothetical protein
MTIIRKLRVKRQGREAERNAALIVGLDWLNERPSKARSRVVRLIELLKASDLLSRKLRDSNASLSDKLPHQDERDKLLSTLDEINEIFALYRGTRVLWVSEQFGLKEMFGLNSKRLERDDTYYTETRLINYALELLRRGSIQRVRTCRECNEWFYAMTDHQSHCGDNCRQRFASHDPFFKERRREYMKKYRREERERDERLQQISRRKH